MGIDRLCQVMGLPLIFCTPHYFSRRHVLPTDTRVSCDIIRHFTRSHNINTSRTVLYHHQRILSSRDKGDGLTSVKAANALSLEPEISPESLLTVLAMQARPSEEEHAEASSSLIGK